ncbi:MAG: plasmid recombination protein [Defluviitaleaceae bacterium]|nr:plasmid recombination protein [Defluviitaleaceae bacterium]
MAHVAKYTQSQAGGLTRHFERSINPETGEHIRFSNQEIDLSRVHLNYNLAPDQNQLNFIKQRCSEVQCMNRKDVNVMCSWVVTAPKNLPEDNYRQFFEETYKFLNERYGEKNVISAYVHMDEVTPHMHYAFVPIVKDKKKDIEKVSAKELVNRKDLQVFHADLSKHLEGVFGRDVGILNEATKEGNRSIEELKRQSAIDRLREAQEITKINISASNEKLKEATLEASRIVSKAESDVRYLRSDVKGLRAEYDAKKAYVKTFVDQKGIYDNVIEKKSLTGKTKGYELTPEKWEKIAITYMDMIASERMRDSVEKTIEKFKESTSHKQVVKMKATLENEIKKLKIENKELREQINNDGQFINQALEVFKVNPEVERLFFETVKQIEEQRHEAHQQKKSKSRGMEL